MYSKYYQKELFHLRELAKEFSEAHPAIAPMLSRQSSDPDVERLLEGTAFLSGLLQQKIDDQFPEIIHALTNYIFPHFLRSIPSVTMVRFTPRKGLQEAIQIPAQTELGSRPVEKSTLLFRTSYDCTVHPLKITTITKGGTPTRGEHIEVSFKLTGPTLETWNSDTLSFFIGGSYGHASDIFYLLSRKLRKIVVLPEGGSDEKTLAGATLQPTGFQQENALFSYPGNAFTGYHFLQEFFLLPHTFLFLELQGLKAWQERGNGDTFTLRFELEPSHITLPAVDLDSLLLSTVPAVNLYKHDADPVILDYSRDQIRISPALHSGRRPEVYGIDKVTGFTRGAVEKVDYTPATRFSSATDSHIYSLIHSISPVHNRPQFSLQFALPAHPTSLVEETLSVELTCMDGDLPRQLKSGDICEPTSSTPELVDFSNLMQPTLPIDPPLTGDILWRLLSHLSLNLLSLASVENLKELLELYVFSQDRDRGRLSINKKRLDGIEEFTVTQTNSLIRGHMMRGQKIHLTARSDHFASQGDFCLFGTVMDTFFAEYCSMNSFTQFDLTDSVSGETYEWPTRVGNKPLI